MTKDLYMEYVTIIGVVIVAIGFCSIVFDFVLRKFNQCSPSKQTVQEAVDGTQYGRYSIVFRDGSKHTIIGVLSVILKDYPVSSYKRII